MHMKFYTYENYLNPTVYNAVLQSHANKVKKSKILSDAFKFNGKFVNNTASFTTESDREKFIAWVLLKFS